MRTINYLLAGLAAATMLFSCEKAGGPDDGENPELAPKADFAFSVEEGTGKVSFTNKSSNASSYEWEFGDEKKGFSTEENPTYTYEKTGTYQVSLTAIEGTEVDTKTMPVTVEIVVEKQEVHITIDGDFSDWANIPWREDVSFSGALTGIKTVATTKNNVYILMEGTDEFVSKGYIPRVALDADNDRKTGNTQCWHMAEGEDGTELMQQAEGFYVYGWQPVEQKIGMSWVPSGGWFTAYTNNTLIDGKIYSEWKLDMTVGTAAIIGNSAFSDAPEGTDLSQFATKVSKEKYRVAIYWYDNSWGFLASAPEEGGIPFEVKVDEYIEL